jgi:hypothetical protein
LGRFHLRLATPDVGEVVRSTCQSKITLAFHSAWEGSSSRLVAEAGEEGLNAFSTQVHGAVASRQCESGLTTVKLACSTGLFWVGCSRAKGQLQLVPSKAYRLHPSPPDWCSI